MGKIATILAALSCMVVLVQTAYGQQAEAPAYKDGDWWKFQAEREQRGGVTKAGACQYPEYLVAIEQGQPTVYGMSGDEKTKVDCPVVTGTFLNIPSELGYLKFPLSVNATWTTKQFYTPAGARNGFWLNWNTKVISFEKIKTEKQELSAFKIERTAPAATETYFYSPQIKAIVRYELTTQTRTTKVALIDFNVEP